MHNRECRNQSFGANTFAKTYGVELFGISDKLEGKE